jgi:hypothetical protein
LPSGYFSAPEQELDPNLFDGDHMKDDVRKALLQSLYNGLEYIGLKQPEDWAFAWLAGSGASYQWSADRGNGDLDVLFGAEFAQMLQCNPHIPRLSMAEIAKYVDDQLRSKYWPQTAKYRIGTGVYEVTFFWNPTTTNMIENIHPYAAYNLIGDFWVVHPPELPADLHSLYPKSWYDFTDADYRQARAISSMNETGGSLGQLQAGRAARTLWESIHGGRKTAFSDTGGGYGDFHNFRWQRGKETGTVDILRGFIDSDPEPEESPGDLITRAALRYASPRYYQ